MSKKCLRHLNVMASAAEQDECTLRSKRQHIEGIVQLPYEIFVAIFCNLPTPVVLHQAGAVCRDWHAIVKDDELWRLRCGLSELPSGFSSWFAYAQRQTIREQALDHLYGRAGLTQNWCKGMQLLSVLADAGDDYAMALYGWALRNGVGIAKAAPRGQQLSQQSKNSMARARCLANGFGVSQDHNALFRVLNTECDTADLHVQFLLGYSHQFGVGCVKNEAQALKCYERAGNHIGALTWLSSLRVAASEHTRAATLARHAAEQGYRNAQYSLGGMYEQGQGVLKDLQHAQHWYTLAAQQGHDYATKSLQRIARFQLCTEPI